MFKFIKRINFGTMIILTLYKPYFILPENLINIAITSILLHVIISHLSTKSHNKEALFPVVLKNICENFNKFYLKDIYKFL